MSSKTALRNYNGDPGTFPLMKSVMVPIHIEDLKVCSVDVDTYSWLHKGALSCSMELCKSQPTSKTSKSPELMKHLLNPLVIT
ncbi:hypothetical protein LXL04_011444 [Taraxacum kok-saghyz]